MIAVKGHAYITSRFAVISVCASAMLLLQFYQVSAMECGTVNIVRPRVLGGQDALKGEWPFIAAIQNQSDYICGGTIISNRHILTAAHCIRKKNSMLTLLPEEVTVRLGAYNLTTKNEEEAIERNVSHIFVHPDWDEFVSTFDADIAILVLSENITFSYDIQPVCMPADGITKNIEGTVVGWGLQENRTYAEIPRQTILRAINYSHCFREDGVAIITSSARTFCAGEGDGSPSRGDSGGGYFLISGSAWVQYGIVSAIHTNATGHAIPDAYHIYTNLTEFKNWMVETVNQTGGVVGEAVMNMVMNCSYDYTESTKSAEKARYTCWLYDIDVQRNNVGASRFVGSHLFGKTDGDVEMIQFYNGTMSYLPNGFGFFFDNIKFMTVGKGNSDSITLGTKMVKRADLQNLENLQEITFLRNDIEILNGDSLWDLPNLKIFKFVQNKLKMLSDETFIKNGKLIMVSVTSNQLNSLPANLFESNLLLDTVDFRDNFLKTVDEKIFATNTRLQLVLFASNQLKVLPPNLFKNMLSLTLVDFKNNSLSSLDSDLFETNVNLTSISFGSNGIESLPGNLFRNNLLLDLVDFRNNSLTNIDDNLFERNKKLKSVSFAWNKLEFVQRSLFKSNSLLQWLDFYDNRLKFVDIDFSEFQYVRLVDLRRNNCVSAKYVRKNGRLYWTLEEFQKLVTANCFAVV